MIERYALLSESCFETMLCVVDAVGFGEECPATADCHWKPITDYIDAKNEAYWKHTVSLDRFTASSALHDQSASFGRDANSVYYDTAQKQKLADGRIHCCLYFLSPHSKGLRPLDVGAMKAIGEKCNLVPIIAKADTLSHSELVALKAVIRETIKAHGITAFDSVYAKLQQQQAAIAASSFGIDEGIEGSEDNSNQSTFQYTAADEDDGPIAQRTAETLNAFPLAVIGASEDCLCALYTLNSHSQMQQKVALTRAYHWGTVDVENETYSDFKRVRSLLFRVNMDDLIVSTHLIHWERYRKGKIQSCASIAMKKSSFPTIPNNTTVQEETSRLIGEAKAELEEYCAKEEKRLKEYEQSVRDLKERLEREIEKEHYEVREIQEKLIGFQQRRGPAAEVANC